MPMAPVMQVLVQASGPPEELVSYMSITEINSIPTVLAPWRNYWKAAYGKAEAVRGTRNTAPASGCALGGVVPLAGMPG